MHLNASNEFNFIRLGSFLGEQGINSQSSPNWVDKLFVWFSSLSSRSLPSKWPGEALKGAINCVFANAWAWLDSRRVANGLFRTVDWFPTSFASNQSSLQCVILLCLERLFAKVDLPAPDLPRKPQHKPLTTTALAWNTTDPFHARSKGVIWFLIRCSQMLWYFGVEFAWPKCRTASRPVLKGLIRKLRPSSYSKIYSSPHFEIVRCKEPFTPCCWRICAEIVGLNNLL